MSDIHALLLGNLATVSDPTEFERRKRERLDEVFTYVLECDLDWSRTAKGLAGGFEMTATVPARGDIPEFQVFLSLTEPLEWDLPRGAYLKLGGAESGLPVKNDYDRRVGALALRLFGEEAIRASNTNPKLLELYHV